MTYNNCFINKPNYYLNIDKPKYDLNIDKPMYYYDVINKYNFNDEKKYTFTERELMIIFESLNELKKENSNNQQKSTSTKSTQTEKDEFTLNDAYMQFDTFMENEQNKEDKTIEPVEFSNDIIGKIDKEDKTIEPVEFSNDIIGKIVEEDDFVECEYSICEERFKELEVKYNHMCYEMEELLYFTTEEEAKIKQEYMEYKEKLFNWM